MTNALISAVRLLSRREHGAVELADKLMRKGFSQEEIQEAIATCQKQKLQCDTRFIESYSRTRSAQGYGPLRIIQELKNKGVETELITCVINQQQYNWLEHALAVWKKKSKGEQDLSYIEQQKQQRFLLYRGFSPDIIEEVLRVL